MVVFSVVGAGVVDGDVVGWGFGVLVLGLELEDSCLPTTEGNIVTTEQLRLFWYATLFLMFEG